MEASCRGLRISGSAGQETGPIRVVREPVNDERADRNDAILGSRFDVVHRKLNEGRGVALTSARRRRICVREVQRTGPGGVVGDADKVVSDTQGVTVRVGFMDKRRSHVLSVIRETDPVDSPFVG